LTFFHAHCGPGVNSASHRKEYPGGEGSQCVELTTSPLSCADCLEILEPQPPGTHRACPVLYRDYFTFTFYRLMCLYDTKEWLLSA